jgi:hypothetical protein
MDNEQLRFEIESLDEQINFLKDKRAGFLLTYKKNLAEFKSGDVIENLVQPGRKFIFIEYKIVSMQVVMVVERIFLNKKENSLEFANCSDTWQKVEAI